MAGKSSSSSSKHKRKTEAKLDVKKLDVLNWNPSLTDDDPFALLSGTNELEGGFLSLEEIDESEYGLVIAEHEKGVETALPSKSKKRKLQDSEGDSAYDSEVTVEEKVEEKKKVKKKNKKKKKQQQNIAPDAVEPEANANNDIEAESVVDETEFHAWNELRLHPMIMRSIYRLGFKEPTPIQKSCIPAAAHQGKDVIGAAETGSGKTLAFGLPILQRLLEEREKAAKSLTDKSSSLEKGPLRALIVTPTRELALQVTAHLKEITKVINVRVVPIVGGMSTEKQERLLKARPEIVVGTPGRLWELMSGGDKHLVELHSVSFFVLDEADRMIESGHFHELQSIIDMLPMGIGSVDGHNQATQNCVTDSNVQRKKRQTLVFSATISLSADFRKKLKHRSLKSNHLMKDGISSIETLSERAGMRADAAIIDLTNASIVADKLEESFIECREEDKDAYLYYILSVHGQGRTIVFCTSIAALRHISSILRILGISCWTLHAQMQQRARLKAVDRFRGNEHGILIATDVAARGLDIPGVRTVVHYQLPHSAEVYVHRSGRTARASADGCSIALISPSDRSKFTSLCRSFSKESLQRFPVDDSYMPEVMKRLSFARQIDKISRKDSQDKANKNWLDRSAESVELDLEDHDSEEERVNNYKLNKVKSIHLQKLQQELKELLSCPLQPKTFSRRFLAGAGVSSLLQHQFEELVRQKTGKNGSLGESKRGKLLVIGQDCVEPLQALRSVGHEAGDSSFKHQFEEVAMRQFEEVADQNTGEDGSSRESKRGKLTVNGQDHGAPPLHSAGHEACKDVEATSEKQRKANRSSKRKQERKSLHEKERKRLHEKRRKERKRLKCSSE